jgi:hypothetical protein
MKSRNEIIVEEIIRKGKRIDKQSAFSFLRSESAKAEAELVHISRLSQSEAIDAIESIKAKDLEQYKTQKLLKDIENIFGRMIGNSEIVARRMVIANILSSKVNSVMRDYSTGDKLIEKIQFTEGDYSRIDRIVSDIVEKIKRGVSFSMASINTTIQNLAIRVNMNRPIVLPNEKKSKEKDNYKKKDESPVEQEVISSSFAGEQVKSKKAQKSYTDKPLTQDELESIKRNPISYANRISKQNVKFVTDLHNRYLKGIDTPLNSDKQRMLSDKNANGNQTQKSIFELGVNLRKNGLFAFIDKGNKRWTLTNYCAMSVRTTSSQSTNMGELFADEKHDLYYIVPHGGSCPLCKKYEGRVYSRSGNNPNYPPLSTVFNKIDPNGSDDLSNRYFTIHPNCRHKIIKYYEKSHTKAKQSEMKIASNRPFELTRKQKEEVRFNKERSIEEANRNKAMREFLTYLQVLPPKDVCGNFIKFYEHKKNNDAIYKQVKKKYEEKVAKL